MRALLATLALSLLAACGAEGPPVSNDPASLIVENASQYVLNELRFHATSSYADAPNVLPAPLAIGAEQLRFGSGTVFVTVLREKFRGGEDLALTTMYPLELVNGEGYRLKVFDASFRLEASQLIVKTSTGS